MICLKNRRVMIYSLLGLFAFFFTSFFVSSSVFATSVSCSFSYDSNSNYYNLTSNCNIPTNWSHYYIKEDFSALYTTSYNSGTAPYILFYLSPVFDSNVPHLSFVITQSGSQSGSFYYDLSTIPSSNFLFRWIRSGSALSTFSATFTLTFSDVAFDIPSDCPDCPDCPEIPENPYDDKLDKIVTAIYTCGAVLIALYFFFCLYHIFFNGGRR